MYCMLVLINHANCTWHNATIHNNMYPFHVHLSFCSKKNCLMKFVLNTNYVECLHATFTTQRNDANRSIRLNQFLFERNVLFFQCTTTLCSKCFSIWNHFFFLTNTLMTKCAWEIAFDSSLSPKYILLLLSLIVWLWTCQFY